jgi:transposase
LAQLRDPRCKNDEETIAKSLQGHWREDHLFELAQAVELYRTYHAKIAECDQHIERYLKGLPDRSQGAVLPPKRGRINRHTPHFDARKLLFQITGVDLTSVDGIDTNTALKVISEIGTNIHRWPTMKHFASWLCLCPGNKKSGGKVLSTKTRHSSNRAAQALRVAAQSLERSPSALGAYLRRMKARIGAAAAITATAHKLARILYSLLRNGQTYVDIGQEAFERQYQERMLHNLNRRAAKFGYALVQIKSS